MLKSQNKRNINKCLLFKECHITLKRHKKKGKRISWHGAVKIETDCRNFFLTRTSRESFSFKRIFFCLKAIWKCVMYSTSITSSQLTNIVVTWFRALLSRNECLCRFDWALVTSARMSAIVKASDPPEWRLRVNELVINHYKLRFRLRANSQVSGGSGARWRAWVRRDDIKTGQLVEFSARMQCSLRPSADFSVYRWVIVMGNLKIDLICFSPFLQLLDGRDY